MRLGLDVCLAPALIQPDAVAGSIVAVIDVLRASTTICTALASGAASVVPFADVADARRAYDALTPSERERTLLGGERHGIKPDGFHCGNSPLEYSGDSRDSRDGYERVAGKTIFFTTTNGTRALAASDSASQRCIAGFVNARCAAAWMLARANHANQSKSATATIILLCAGSDGAFSLEDTLCAGLLVDEMMNQMANQMANQTSNASLPAAIYACSDAAHAARQLYLLHKPTLLRTLESSQHAQTLTALGFERDLGIAFATNSLNVLPAMHNGAIVLAHDVAHDAAHDVANQSSATQ